MKCILRKGYVSEADTWLKTNIEAYAQWAVAHHSLLMVVWDEDDSSAANQIPGILYGANINPGTYNTSYNHYDILASLAGSFALTAPNNGATATGLSGMFKTSLAQWSTSVDIGLHPAGYAPALVGDFNHDCTSDLLWFNAATRDVDLWLMQNGQWSGSLDVGIHPAGWTPVASGDFNHDGTGDVLWFSAATNGAEIWEIRNDHWAASVDLGAHPAGWTIAGVGDLNHDGGSDILWRETATGRIEDWLLTAA